MIFARKSSKCESENRNNQKTTEKKKKLNGNSEMKTKSKFFATFECASDVSLRKNGKRKEINEFADENRQQCQMSKPKSEAKSMQTETS